MTTIESHEPIHVGLPEEGQLVKVRSRMWIVGEVKRDALADARDTEPNHLVTLSSIEEDGFGEELEVAWELEPGRRVYERMGLPEADGMDTPEQMESLINSSRWAISSNSDFRHVQSPFRSGIEIEDYQLDPLLRAINMPRANLLIADDVGLGKTIETGLILLEFIIRHRAKKMLIVCPPVLQEKWQEEMQEKFGLEFTIVDKKQIGRLRRQRGVNINPWERSPRLITSMHFLKRPRWLRQFKETLPGPNDPIYPRSWDMLVLDEAQNCAPSGTGNYALDSDCTTAIREIAPHFQHRLFLSATPHNGYPESWAALLEMLDDQRFARGETPDQKRLVQSMVRRLKSEIPDYPDGTPRFPKRVVHAEEVDYSEAEYEMHNLLASFGELRKNSSSDNKQRFATSGMQLLLKKRLFSSPMAFLNTLKKYENTLRCTEGTTVSQASMGFLEKRFAKLDEEFAVEEEREESEYDAIKTASEVQTGLTKDEDVLFKKMIAWGQGACGQKDSKASCLIDWLNENIKPSGKWTEQRVIIFTEYRDTQNWLHDLFAREGLAEDGRLEMLYGGMDSKKRKHIMDSFQASPSITPVRILLATECAGEGIDLQNHCDQMFHYEIPWNPNRLEQRNGRIDRRGQPSKEVHIHHFVAKGYEAEADESKPVGQLFADLEFLMRAVNKIETIRKELGSVGPVIAEQVQQAMLGERVRLDTADVEKKASAAAKRLPIEKDIAQRIKKMHDQLQETRDALHLDPEAVEAAVTVALQMEDKPPLKLLDQDGGVGNYRIFEMPNFEGSWTECRKGLFDPITNKVRPITFDHDAAKALKDVVLVHLNHPLVQKCLRRLRAEIWRPADKKRMHRITAVSVPADKLEDLGFIMYSRMTVVGSSRYRLHEEVLTAGGSTKSGKWYQFSQDEMSSLLASASTDPLPEELQEQLLSMLTDTQSKLETAMRARVKDRKVSVTKQLDDRRDKELNDVADCMKELKLSIQARLKDEEQEQLSFADLHKSWKDEEQKQFDRNRAALLRTLKEIPGRIEDEQEDLSRRFQDQDVHDFPIAITILVPEGWTHG